MLPREAGVFSKLFLIMVMSSFKPPVLNRFSFFSLSLSPSRLSELSISFSKDKKNYNTMPSSDLILDLINRLPFILIRIFTVILLLMHLLFSVIIVRQTRILSTIIEAQISPTIQLISILHLLASLVVLIFAAIFLFFMPL